MAHTLTQKRLKQVVRYDSNTGVFTWVSTEKVAGSIDAAGYIKIQVDYKCYRAHRLAFLYMYGSFPITSIDHKNRIKHDNRWENLRLATPTQQMQNRSMMKNNTSGVCGVYWCKSKNRWRVEISNGMRSKFVGLCSSLVDAAYLRLAAEQCLGYDSRIQVSSAKECIGVRP